MATLAALITVLSWVLVILVGLAAAFTAWFALASVAEGERSAAGRAGFVTAAMMVLAAALVVARSEDVLRLAMAGLAMGALAASGYVLLSRRGQSDGRLGTTRHIVGPVQRYDERDNVFARARTLTPDRPEFAVYYSDHPELRASDDELRAGSPVGAKVMLDSINRHNMRPINALTGISTMLGTPAFREGPSGAPLQPELSALDLTAYVKGLGRKLGADLIGVARLNPLWVYSHRGQIFHGDWENWGQPITLNHPFVVVFAIEMEPELLLTTPASPGSTEVVVEYGRAVHVGVQLSHALNSLGHEARAHHWRGQEILLVPAAVDAGLGELSRMGYLVTRQFGPRVRLGAVTTTAPLVPDAPVDIGVEAFCAACKRCARLCPSRSVPEGEQTEAGGLRRWKIDGSKCYLYWTKVGNFCSVCMATCPWSHVNSPLHNLTRSLAARFPAMHPALIWGEDFFYGKKFRPRRGPAWIDRRARSPG